MINLTKKLYKYRGYFQQDYGLPEGYDSSIIFDCVRKPIYWSVNRNLKVEVCLKIYVWKNM